MQMAKWDTKKMRNLGSRNSQSQNESNESNEQRNKNMKIQDMLCAGVGVLLVLKAEVLVDNIELNNWRKGERKNKNMKIQDMLSTGVGVWFVSKVVVLWNIFNLNRRKNKKESEQPQWWLLVAVS